MFVFAADVWRDNSLLCVAHEATARLRSESVARWILIYYTEIRLFVVIVVNEM